MEYTPILNLLLEALAYLGRRANGFTVQWLADRLEREGVADPERTRRLLAPIGSLMDRLDREVELSGETLTSLFRDLPGFSYNTIGSYSPAFLLLFPLVSKFDGDLAHTLEAARQRTPERLAGDLAQTLEISEETTAQWELTGDDFSARVLALSIPAESKVAILDLYHRPESVLTPAAALLGPVLDFLKENGETMTACCAPFTRKLLREGPEQFLAQTSALSSRCREDYRIYPFLFGLDTNLAVTPEGGGPVQVYCGILRQSLQEALDSARGPEYDVYNAIRLLADQTRFEILCYLRDHNAYGQELAAKFGLSRNTIHHHMTKLLAAHLVKCTVDGNRVYYTVDAKSVCALLNRQRQLLLPDPMP